MKKFIALAVVFIMILTFAGCSNENDGGTDNLGGQNNSNSVADTGSSNGGSSGSELSGNSSSEAATSSNKGNSTTQSTSSTSSTNKIDEDKARTLVEGKGEAWTLANTYKKLTQDKELTIAYLGGSVTWGTGSTTGNSWREITTKWFKKTYPGATINEVNAAIGGTGSLYGFQRLKKDVLKKDPDLVFIEFAMNDVYENMTQTKAAANIDAIIRKINAYNPEIDIVLVFITSEGNMGKDYLVKQGHRHVAEYYGVPYIDVGNAIAAEISKTGKPWNYYFGDVVHPNDKGYKVYADEVEKNLINWLNEAKAKTPKQHVINKTPAVTYPYDI